MKGFDEGKKTDEDEGDGGERPQQAGSREKLANPVGAERAGKLEQAAHEERTDSDVPSVGRGRRFLKSQLIFRI